MPAAAARPGGTGMPRRGGARRTARGDAEGAGSGQGRSKRSDRVMSGRFYGYEDEKRASLPGVLPEAATVQPFSAGGSAGER